MYNVESKDGYNVYTFQGVNLKIKSVVHEDNTFVYINYNGYNPLLSMLFGDFEAECKNDSIDLTVQRAICGTDNSMYAVVNNDDLIGFVKEVYFFVMENQSVLNDVLNSPDRCIWEF